MTDSVVPAIEREAAMAFFEDHPALEVMIPDVNAVLRGKWLPQSGFARVFRDGLRLPCSALRLFAESAFVETYLGERYRRLYTACKRQQLEFLASQITDREYEAYLRAV